MRKQLTEEQIRKMKLRILRAICDAVLEAIAAAGPGGTNEGVLYLALMSQGATYDTFTGIMSGLSTAGLVRREASGAVYLTERGIDAVARVKVGVGS